MFIVFHNASRLRIFDSGAGRVYVVSFVLTEEVLGIEERQRQVNTL
jgi:hypothetical protein